MPTAYTDAETLIEEKLKNRAKDYKKQGRGAGNSSMSGPVK